MTRRILVFSVLAVAAAALFVRLGFWQLARLRERQTRAHQMAQQLRAPQVPLDEVPGDTAAAHYRPVTVSGQFDYDHELVLTSRTHDGSPGVELLTPLREAGSGRAVLVNRGWVYAPDGGTVDRARWREGDSVRLTGYVELYVPEAARASTTNDQRIVRRVSLREIAPKVPYALAPFYVVAVGDTTAVPTHPVRRALPGLDEGPHRSYAIQWFSFAAIALGGAVAVVRRERRRSI